MKNTNYSYSADILVAILLMIFALPVCIVLAILIRLKLGNPIFYKGERLGKDKKKFNIYKFRTLPNNAQQSVIGAELLKAKHGLTTPFTEFLRDTRLDELPQLWNVIKGDMSFIGPRPERPEIYQSICQKIPNYDKRFLVKPGLLGYSQLFTPHGTPKRMRTLVDNAYIHNETSFWYILKIILYTIGAVIQRVLLRLKHNFNDLFQRKILQRYNEKRKNIRKGLARTQVDIVYKAKQQNEILASGSLVNINHEAFLVYTNFELKDDGEFIYRFIIPNIKRRRSHVPYKIAKCRGCILRTITPPNTEKFKYGYVIFYEPISDFNHYLIEQYILHASLAY